MFSYCLIASELISEIQGSSWGCASVDQNAEMHTCSSPHVLYKSEQVTCCSCILKIILCAHTWYLTYHFCVVFICFLILSTETLNVAWSWACYNANQIQSRRWSPILKCKGHPAKCLVFHQWGTVGDIQRSYWCCVVSWCRLYPFVLNLFLSRSLTIELHSCMNCCFAKYHYRC